MRNQGESPESRCRSLERVEYISMLWGSLVFYRRWNLGVAIFLLLVPPASAQSLCSAREIIVFTCSVKSQILSACASKNLSPHGGYLQFRIGKPGAIGDAYPRQTLRKANAVTYGWASIGPGPEGHYVMLRDGENSYSAVTTDERGPQYGGEVSGFVMQSKGKTVRSLSCDAPVVEPTDQGLELLDKAGFENVSHQPVDLPQ